MFHSLLHDEVGHAAKTRTRFTHVRDDYKGQRELGKGHRPTHDLNGQELSEVYSCQRSK